MIHFLRAIRYVLSLRRAHPLLVARTVPSRDVIAAWPGRLPTVIADETGWVS